MARDEALASALAHLDAACCRLQKPHGVSPFADGVGHKNGSLARRGKGRVRLERELSEQERTAVRSLALAGKQRFQARRSKPIEVLAAETAQIEWDNSADADEAAALVRRFKQLRARRAGLQMRQQQQQNQEQQQLQATQGKSQSSLEVENADADLNALREQLKLAREQLGDAEAAETQLETSRARIRKLRNQLDDLDGHVRDMRSLHSSKSPASKAGATPDTKGVGESSETSKSQQACDDFARKANEFELAKRHAAHKTASLRGLRDKVNEMRQRLEALQEEARVKQLVEAALRETMTHALKTASLGDISEETQASSGWQARAMAKSLSILLDEGGEMLLNDWKKAIAEALELSSAKVIQFVYGLVANTLVSIDRTQKDARVIAHIA